MSGLRGALAKGELACFARLGHSQNPAFHDLVLRVLRPVSLETSSEPRAPTRPGLRCSGPFRWRLPRNSGFQDVVREVLRPVLTETSWELWVPICPDLRCSGPFRLRHPHNSLFQMLFARCSGPFHLRHLRNPGKSEQFKFLRFASQPSGLESNALAPGGVDLTHLGQTCEISSGVGWRRVAGTGCSLHHALHHVDCTT